MVSGLRVRVGVGSRAAPFQPKSTGESTRDDIALTDANQTLIRIEITYAGKGPNRSLHLPEQIRPSSKLSIHMPYVVKLSNAFAVG